MFHCGKTYRVRVVHSGSDKNQMFEELNASNLSHREILHEMINKS